ncbi:hypothetical protein PMW_187 [Pseudomonas phage phiPMW]|uniref:Uncharacterized protein n=1 Tax=Pseudomonas phage phiPMW TaxID=1815582 RepID=A0A1S5R1K3_9CAUD|nr:hypothetical protein FDG97_gp163 [Pseudomonas phage phiPMW]ANA49312.1 hypothetical protein PMW_187 [Pseudomonas phage phiPMW]
MRGMKFDVRNYSNEEFRALQYALFEMGYGWGNTRNPRISNKSDCDTFLYANPDGAMRQGMTEEYFLNSDNHLEIVECEFKHTVKVIIPDPKPVELVEIDGVRYKKDDVLAALALNQVEEFLQ